MILLGVYINTSKFEYWKQDLTAFYPDIVDEMQEVIWKGKNLKYLREKFKHELVPNVINEHEKILDEVQQQLLKVNY